MMDLLWEEMELGRIWEVSLRSEELQVFGLSEGQNIYIDARLAIIEVLIHELLHRRFPDWSERKVRKTTKALTVRLSEQEKRRWWRGYKRVSKKGRPKHVDE